MIVALANFIAGIDLKSTVHVVSCYCYCKILRFSNLIQSDSRSFTIFISDFCISVTLITILNGITIGRFRIKSVILGITLGLTLESFIRDYFHDWYP